jgi:hypothetical protein
MMAEESVSALLDQLGRRADRDGIDALNGHEQTVLRAWSALGIGNGGFRYWYEGGTDITDAARAFRTLGYADIADACERSLDVFPGKQVPRDSKELYRQLRAIDWKQLASAEEAVYRLTFDELASAIGAYVDRHHAAFRR